MQQSFNSTFVPAPPRKLRRSFQFALVLAALLWYLLADALAGRAARGLSNRFDFEAGRSLLSALFLVFLLLVGYTLLEAVSRMGTATLRRTSGLPRRPTSGREWTLGAAIGWGAAVAAVLPMVLGRSLHVRFWTEQRAFNLLLLNLATLLIAALATEMALRGFPFRLLIEAIGSTWATILLVVTAVLAHALTPESTWISVLVTALITAAFAAAWLRTHGLWLGWGLRFAWNASVALLFGLPLRGVSDFASVVQTRAIRPAWLTGNAFGPEGALFTAVVLIAVLIVLVRTTSDYAWDYTRREIIAAGYEVTPMPPAAHTAMEQEVAARPPSLVQILPSTPQSRSADLG